MVGKRAIVSETVYRINGVPSYSSAIVAGETIYLSGHTSASHVGAGTSETGILSQTRSAFEGLGTDLRAAGGDFGDLVKVTVYVTDRAFLQAYRKVKGDYFRDPPPASTFVVVAGLASPDALIEIEGVAVLDRPQSGR